MGPDDIEKPDEHTVDDQESQARILLLDVARSYVNAWTAGEDELARMLGLSLVRPLPSEVLVSNDLKVVGELGSTAGPEWDGVRVDADLSLLRPVWTDFAGENRIAYPVQLGALVQKLFAMPTTGVLEPPIAGLATSRRRYRQRPAKLRSPQDGCRADVAQQARTERLSGTPR